jgi:HD-GYP domain-containing protein (c-di-GMP phosphodiesterase class II)
LTGAETRALVLARRCRWPHAVLGPDLALVEGFPAAAGWRRLLPRLRLRVRPDGLQAVWPAGRGGAIVPLGAGGWLLLGPWRGAGRDAAVIEALAALLGECQAAQAEIARKRREADRLRDEEASAQVALARKERTLQAVMHIGRTLASVKDLRELVGSSMVPEMVQLLNADRGSVFLIDAEHRELYSIIAMGVEFKEIRMPLDRGLAGWVATTGGILNVADAHEDPRFNPEFDHRTGYRTRSVLAVPLMDPLGKQFGVIQVINKNAGPRFTREDEELLVAVASEAAVAILNTQLVEKFRALFESVISAMATALDARDNSTAGHTHRVTDFALGVGRILGLTRNQLERIRLAGILHDIGKIGTPDAILKKPGLLTSEERAIMNRHADNTRHIISTLKLPDELVGLADEAAGHHEWWNGTGYPLGLKGEAIPVVSRVMAVADVFDAITSHRHYREAMPIDQALATIREGIGTHFDPACVNAFFRLYELELKPQFESAGGSGARA